MEIRNASAFHIALGTLKGRVGETCRTKVTVKNLDDIEMTHSQFCGHFTHDNSSLDKNDDYLSDS
jgi:hypothetical protein